MKKPVAAVLLVALAAGAWWAAAAYTSREVPKRFQAELDLLQKRFPGMYLTDVKQTSGLTSGTYSARVHLGCQPGTPAYRPDADISFGVEQDLQYGPFPGFKSFGAARINTHLVLPDNLPAPMGKLVDIARTLEIRGDYGYGGGSQGLVRLPSGELAVDSPAGPVKISWAEARMDTSATADLANADVHFAWPELKADGTSGHVLLRNMSFAQTTTGAGLIWLRPGHGEAALEHMEAGGPNMQFSLDKFQVKADTQRGDFVDGTVGYTIGAIDVQAGRPFKLKDFALQMSAKHWQAAATDKLMEQFSQLGQMQCMVKPDPTTDVRAAMVAQYKPLLATLQVLLAQDPAVSIEQLGFELEGQRGEASAGLAFKGFKAPAASDDPGAVPAALMQAGTAQGKVSLPMAWLALAGGPERAEQLAQGLTAQGFFVRDGDKLKAEFALGQGKATLNGNPVPLPGMAAGAEEAPAAQPPAASGAQ
ncbi:MAG: DUF945 family protein [Paucibacter sp.]|nr:DUF945 family protein [Roseateles sp.]